MDESIDDDLDVSYGLEEDEVFSILDESVASVNASFESTFDSFIVEGAVNPYLASTPTKSRRKEKNLEQDPFKKPQAVQFAKCPVCRRSLKTQKGFNNHMRGHKLKDALNRHPSLDDVAKYCKTRALDILQSMAADISSKCRGVTKSELLQYTEKIISESRNGSFADFVDYVTTSVVMKGLSLKVGKGFAFPSALRQDLQKTLSLCYCDANFRNIVIGKFKSIESVPDSEAWVLIFDFIKKLCDEVLIYCCKSVQGEADRNQNFSTRRKRSCDDYNHFMSHQLIHYISGSTLRTFVRHAYKYPKNKRLQRRKMCILSRFGKLGGPAISDLKDKSYWTAVLNRKALLFVNDNAFPFFLEVGKMISSLEKADGSLGHDAVLEAIVSDERITSMWDSIVGTALCEDESFSLMMKVIRSLTNTYGKGIMIRRMNKKSKTNKANKATLAISHRARLT